MVLRWSSREIGLAREIRRLVAHEYWIVDLRIGGVRFEVVATCW